MKGGRSLIQGRLHKVLVLLCVNEGLLNKEKKEQMLLVQYTVRWLGVTLEQELKGKVVDPRR